MIADILLTVSPDDETNSSLIQKKAKAQLAKKNINTENKKVNLVFVKKSIDARHGTLKLCLKYRAYIDEDPPLPQDELPTWKNVEGNKSVIIIGAGPAALFSALHLLEYAIKPILIERGSDSQMRKKTIAQISTEQYIDPDSNYCFGEGGAGTFSDGKLYTRSDKRGNVERILKIFNHFGASDEILTDAHPHIGTDKLPSIIQSIRKKILDCCGEIYFNTKCVDFIIEEISTNTKQNKVIRGVVTQNTKTGETLQLVGDSVILATGHSANDIYELIAHHSPEGLEAKPFAIGVRVEHPRQYIDSIQHHGKNIFQGVEYRLNTQVEDRGVYSFCMCPGGFVVPSSTSNEEIVVNGMSSAKRNSFWSNSAIIVETRIEDIPEEFVSIAENKKCRALAGLYWRTSLEQEAKKHGNGQKAPAQMLEDFLAKKDSSTLVRTSYTPGIVASRLDEWLPEHIGRRLSKAFQDFNSQMKGFICKDALLIAIETRTSTPVRILRNKETGESISIQNLYPAGEGSGFAGGI
ncbi:MAG: FAD-binding protein, partial [Treponema sp.]|nr:FAD-binding protein [Treponema sp.]